MVPSAGEVSMKYCCWGIGRVLVGGDRWSISRWSVVSWVSIECQLSIVAGVSSVENLN